VRTLWRFQTRLILIVILASFVPLLALTNVMFARLMVRIEERTYALVRDGLERSRLQIESLCLSMITITNMVRSSEGVQAVLAQAASASPATCGFEERLRSGHLAAADFERLSRVENQLDLIKTTVFFNYDSDILVFDEQGIIYNSCDTVDAYSLKLAYMSAYRREGWYRAFTEGRQTIEWIAPFSYASAGIGGPRLVSVVRDIEDARTNARIGLVMANVSEENFQRIFKGSDSASTALLTGSPDVVRLTRGDFDRGLAEEAEARLHDGGYTVLGSGPRRSMVVVLPVARFGWVLVSILPYARVVEEVTALRAQVYGVTAGGYLVVLVATILLVVHSSRPLRRLVERASSISIAGRGMRPTPLPSDRTDLLTLSRTVETMVERMRELTEEVVEEQRREHQLRREMLQAQIHPHFLFNALNAIKWTAHMCGARSVTNMLASLGAILEASMRLDEDEIRLEVELKLLRDFLLLENARRDRPVVLEEEVEEPARGCRIVKLLLQPIVENAAKHARPADDAPTVVRVAARVTGGRLEVSVSDNGEGGPRVPADGEPGTTGIGLGNVRERLRLRYGEELRIVRREGGGTEVSFGIPEVRA